MKRWKCTVCGYIHTGDEPPDECPVCGADKSKFVEIAEDGSEVVAEEKAESNTPSADRWKCAVCGYKHKGDTPPEECLVCGSDKSRFFPDEDKEETKISSIQPKKTDGQTTVRQEKKAEPKTGTYPSWLTWLSAIPYPPWLEKLTKEMTRWHAHPISVHFPNGVLPVSFLFIILSVATGSTVLSKAAFYNLVVVLLAMPMVLFSGYNDWQRRFGGHMTKVFQIKLICGAIVSIGTLFLAVWWAIKPEMLIAGGSGRGFFLLVAVIVLGAGIAAGFYGGKLVFPNDE